MKKKIMIPFLIAVLAVGLAVLIFVFANKDKLVFNYEQSSQTVASKSVYKKSKLIVYADLQLRDEANLQGVYDKDFKPINAEATYSYKNGKLTINCEEADSISGFKIGDYDTIYSFRYLDSSECAVLVQTMACDAGWIESSGYEEYYTFAEKAEHEAREQAVEDARQQAFETVKGKWYSEDGLMYMDFHEENGRRLISIFYGEYDNSGDAIIQNCSANWISIVENEKKYIKIDEDAGYIITTLFELSPDSSIIINTEKEEPILFYREKQN